MDTAKTKARSNFGGRGWLLVLLCIGGCFMSSSMSGSLNVSSTVFNEMFGWSQTQLMLGATFGTLVGVVISIVGGKLLINRSPRRVILICALIYAVCFYLNGHSVSLAMFYITFIIGTACAFIWSMICNPMLIANWFPRKTGLAMGWVTMGLPLGAGISAFIMRAVYVRAGFYASYLPYAIIAVVLAVIYMVGLKDFPTECGCYPDNDKNFNAEQVKAEEAAIKALREKSLWTPKRVFSSKEFWFVWISISCLGFCAGFIAQVVPTMVSFGLTAQVATYCMVGVSLIACVGSFILGKLDAKIGVKKAMIIGCILVFCMAIFEQLNNLPCKVIGFVFVGMIMGGASNFMLSIIMRTWGPKNAMNVFRFAQPLMSLTTGFAATIIAAIAAAFGGNYNMAFLVMGFLGVVALIMIIFIKKSNVDRKEQQYIAEARQAGTLPPEEMQPDLQETAGGTD